MTATATLSVTEEAFPTFLSGGRSAGSMGGVLASAGYASGSGLSPASTGGDIVIAAYTLPANVLNYLSYSAVSGGGGPMLRIRVRGHTAANGNNKTVKVIFGCTTATVGSAVSGGTTLASTGVVAINAKSFVIDAWVKKVGVPDANTQIGGADLILSDATPVSAGVPVYPAATENADILIAITGNAATTATDIVIDEYEILGYA